MVGAEQEGRLTKPRPGHGRPIRVAVAEDQGLLRGAVASMLRLEDDIDVVAECSRADTVMDAVVEFQPDLVLLDIEMPGGDGLNVAGHLAQTWPNVKVVILTGYPRPGYLRRALDNKVAGFLAKDITMESLAAAIRKVMAGRVVIDPELTLEALSLGTNPLSEREGAVLRHMRDGASVREIAKSLFLSEGTVRNYVSQAVAKMSASSRAEAARIADANGWL